MKITSAQFTQFEKTERYWKLDGFLPLPFNLLVGRNASGKSRTLEMLSMLAHLVSGDQTDFPLSSHYDFSFADADGHTIHYELKIDKKRVVLEKLTADGECRLLREGDSGQLYYHELDTMVNTAIPNTVIACVSRRDRLQHPFFEELYKWSMNTLHYRFASNLSYHSGLYLLPDVDQRKDDIQIDLLRTSNAIELFIDASKDDPEAFKNLIIDDMNLLDFRIEDLTVAYYDSLPHGQHGVPPLLLRAEEKGLDFWTWQHQMSRGMFRALSLLIQINYSLQAKISRCIIIDDIGEGLDYDRSTRLINLLRDKTANSKIQLFISSNDRFVMNNTDLRSWSVIDRQGCISYVHNYLNSREQFEDFEFTGLANFDFLSTEFYRPEST